MRSYLTSLMLILLATSLATADQQRPNIVFLLTDDQRADLLGVAGNKYAKTPNLDELAGQGTLFENAFVTTSICMTSRASIMLGQHALRHGINAFNVSLTQDQLQASYFGQLKSAGYQLGFIGKWGVGSPPEDFFDFNRGFPGQGKYYSDEEGQAEHLTARMGNEALEFLNQVETDRNFCLSISFKAPHVEEGHPENVFNYDRNLKELYSDVTIPRVPLTEPKYYDQLPDFLKSSENRKRWTSRFATKHLAQASLKGYYRLVAGVDLVVGQIRAALEERGLADNTVIIFSSDNGFYLGERGLAGKWYAHEESIRVPLIVYDPRIPESQAGQRRAEMALNIDLPSTILDYANLTSPPSMQGRSLKPLVDGNSFDGTDGGPGWPSNFFYGHYLDWNGIPKSEAVRTHQWKYITYLDVTPPYEELYDLTKDPLEATNLADQPESASTLQDFRRLHKVMRLTVQ